MSKFIPLYKFTVGVNVSQSEVGNLVVEASAQANKTFFDSLAENSNGDQSQAVLKEKAIKAVRKRLTQLKKDEGII